MAKPRVFISSTFYDLKQVRADLGSFIRSLGYDVVRNEEGNIPYDANTNLEDACYKEINSIDILVAIIGGRFGTSSDNDKSYSISNTEIKTAIEHNKQVYIFIDRDVDSEYQTYLRNKDREIDYSFADDKRIFQFIGGKHCFYLLWQDCYLFMIIKLKKELDIFKTHFKVN